MAKKIVVNSCHECKFLYNPEYDPYPDVGWRLPMCTKIQRILWKNEWDGIPSWCPLPDDKE